MSPRAASVMESLSVSRAFVAGFSRSTSSYVMSASWPDPFCMSVILRGWIPIDSAQQCRIMSSVGYLAGRSSQSNPRAGEVCDISLFNNPVTSCLCSAEKSKVNRSRYPHILDGIHYHPISGRMILQTWNTIPKPLHSTLASWHSKVRGVMESGKDHRYSRGFPANKIHH